MDQRPQDNLDIAPEGFEGLQMEAPPDALDRFRRRARLLENTRFVLERQVYAFWIVLNNMLKLIFKKVRVPVEASDERLSRRYRRAAQKSTGERP